MKIYEHFDHELSCITVDEVRWILQRVKRYSAYYTYFLLRASTGIRGGELLEDVRLCNLSPDLLEIKYKVQKANEKRGVKLIKHRRVVIDPWVANELREYLNRTMGIHNNKYVSPYPGQCLFPWVEYDINNEIVGKTNSVRAYFQKLRDKMEKAGFDSQRKFREYNHEGKVYSMHILRLHIFRHFALCLKYYREGDKDLVKCRDWIKHTRTDTTNGYLHPASALGTTEEFLRKASMAEIFGMPERTPPLTDYITPHNECLSLYV